MEEKDTRTPAQIGAAKMWERRRAAGFDGKHSEETKAKMRIAKKEQNDGQQALVDRVARLEARLRGFGFSNEEIRMF